MKMSYAMYRFIIKPIGMKLLLNIENDVKIKELSAMTRMIQGHINIILMELEKDGIVERSYKNRHIGNNVRPAVFSYNRTAKGDKIADAFRTIKKVIEGN